MVFVESPIHEFQYQRKQFCVWFMKENIIALNFDPNEYAISIQSTKIGTNENKAIYSIM